MARIMQNVTQTAQVTPGFVTWIRMYATHPYSCELLDPDTPIWNNDVNTCIKLHDNVENVIRNVFFQVFLNFFWLKNVKNKHLYQR
jgi:hypothetical protein